MAKITKKQLAEIMDEYAYLLQVDSTLVKEGCVMLQIKQSVEDYIEYRRRTVLDLFKLLNK